MGDPSHLLLYVLAEAEGGFVGGVGAEGGVQVGRHGVGGHAALVIGDRNQVMGLVNRRVELERFVQHVDTIAVSAALDEREPPVEPIGGGRFGEGLAAHEKGIGEFVAAGAGEEGGRLERYFGGLRGESYGGIEIGDGDILTADLLNAFAEVHVNEAGFVGSGDGAVEVRPGLDKEGKGGVDVAALENEEAETRRAWRTGRQLWSASARAQMQRSLSEVGRSIEEILACEEENDRELVQHCR